MKRCALRILKQAARRGEMPLYEAIRICHRRGGDHSDQYPLALLIEENYLKIIMNYEPPQGLDRSREYALAVTFHMYLIPPDDKGVIRYQQVQTVGAHDPKEVPLFITAKGALYLDELSWKRIDRIWPVLVGVTTGLLVGLGTEWVKKHFGWP